MHPLPLVSTACLPLSHGYILPATPVPPHPINLPTEEGKIFSPGNLRATFDNAEYQKLVQHYVQEQYTLRYTGGMVPDVFQIIVKEQGVFTNVISPTTKAKLRILFEVCFVCRGDECGC